MRVDRRGADRKFFVLSGEELTLAADLTDEFLCHHEKGFFRLINGHELCEKDLGKAVYGAGSVEDVMKEEPFQHFSSFLMTYVHCHNYGKLHSLPAQRRSPNLQIQGLETERGVPQNSAF